MNDERAEAMLKLVTEIKELQQQSFDRQNRFLWILIPIFAVLCIQTTLLLVR